MLLMTYAAALTKAATQKEAETALTHYLQSFGFRYFAFTYYAGHIKTGRRLRYDFASAPLRPWHLHYLEQAYADVDRTLEENFQMTLPLFWDVHAQLAEAKQNRELRIRDESIEFGIHCGLSLPVHGPHRDFACLTLHQFRGESTLQDYAVKQYEWMAAAQLYYHHCRRILNLTEQAALQTLTKREAQCLTFTAQSWRVEQIAKALSITVRTVNFHLQNANKKLGVNNKHQAAFLYCYA